VLGQLANRVQHALRAFTPRDQKAVKIAAETFPPNPRFKVTDVITQLGVGEALVTTLQEGGVPLPVEKTYMAPPRCRIGSITTEERALIRSRSPIGGKYDTAVNRESAHEILTRRAQTLSPEQAAAPQENVFGQILKSWLFGTSRRQGALEAMTKSTMRTMGNQLGKQILRGILGGISRGR
jgi:hypothetical protein